LAETLGGLYIALVVFMIVLALAWIIMPFAIIGTKPILRELLDEQKRTNALLRQLADRPAEPVEVPRAQPAPAATYAREPAERGVTPAKGRCPNCGHINLMESIKCSGCGAIFDGPGWKLEPIG
jgi:hypothetical protein